MIAALTFSPGRLLVLAIIALCFTLVVIWGVFDGERERAKRAADRQLRREVRRQP